MENGNPKVPELPSVRRYNWAAVSLGCINTEAWSSRWGLDMKLTTSPCKKKYVENLLRKKKILEEAKAHIWDVPLVMMIRSCRSTLP
jgi:hypothetical protein